MGRPNVNWNVGIAAEKQSTYTSKAVKAGIPFASQVTETNTKYIIKYDFNLSGEEVTIPEDCILAFDGGSLKNGTLFCQNIKIEGQKSCLSKISFTENSTCVNDTFYIDWFNIDTSANVLDNNGKLVPGSTKVLCTDEIQSAFNLKTPNVIFNRGRYAFNRVEVRCNCHIIGERDTVLIAQPRIVGERPCDNLFYAKNTDRIRLEGFTLTCLNTTEDTYQLTHFSTGLLYFDTVKSVEINNILISRAHVGWGQGNRDGSGLYEEYTNNYALILCDDCHDTRITNSEFFDSYGSERIGIVHSTLAQDDVNLTFIGNYYHDDLSIEADRGNSPITVETGNHVTLENNLFEDYQTDMSLCNLFANYVFINNNTVKNCRTSSAVFDTTEFGQFLNKSVVVRDNFIESKNSIAILVCTDNLVVTGNNSHTLSFVSVPSAHINDPRDPYWNTHEYAPFAECSFVEISGNEVDCSNYDLNYPYPSQSYRNAISTTPGYVKGNQVVIMNNIIKCPFDVALYVDNYRNVRCPINVGLYDRIIIENNNIEGSSPVAGSSVWCTSVWIDAMNSIYSENINYTIDYLSIRDNKFIGRCHIDPIDPTSAYRDFSVYIGGNAVTRNGLLIIPRTNTFNFYNNNTSAVVTGGAMSVDLLNGDELTPSGSVYEINVNKVNSSEGIAFMQKGKQMRVIDKNGAYDAELLCMQNTSITRYDSTIDAGTLVALGCVISFGETVWQLVGGRNKISDYETLKTVSAAVKDIVRVQAVFAEDDITILREGETIVPEVGETVYTSYWKECTPQKDRVINLDDEMKHGGPTTARPTFSIGLKSLRRGFCYFDTTLNKPIWLGDNLQWVDATGQDVPNP